jgi:hypothetical protein
MERHLGRPLTSKDIVHHKDENKQNNSIDNLELTTRAAHRKVHATTFRDAERKQCTHCLETKSRSEFHKTNAKGKDPHRTACKGCEASINKGRSRRGSCRR